MKILSVLAIIFLTCQSVLWAQNHSSLDERRRNWEQASAWTIGGIPAKTGQNMNITINGFIIETGDLVYDNDVNIIVGAGDTLVIDGSITLKNNSDFIVGANAVLIIRGNLVASQNFTIQSSSKIIIGGSVTTQNNTDIINSGNLYVFGTEDFGTGGGSTYTGTAPGDLEDFLANETSGLRDLVETYTGTLPVELRSFESNLLGEEVQLKWSTASQLNFSHFEVEQSNNARDWIVVASVRGEGTTNELKEYSFTHSAPQNGKNYYRLRMVDFDETYEYSDVVSETVSVGNMLSISPNPTTNRNARYTLNFTPSEGDQIVVYDLMGTVILVNNVISFTDELILPSSLTKGTYLVRYRGQSVNQTQRLVVE